MEREASNPDKSAIASSVRTLVVILAAGAGSRFAASAADASGTQPPGHKLLQPLPDGSGSTITVLERAVANAASAGVGPALVVAGAANIAGLRLGPDTTVVHNPRWEDGQATSVTVAASYAQTHGFDAAVIGLGDQPGITSSAWRDVADTDSPIAVATYDGVRGNPVRLAREVWALLDSEGDAGARTLMRVRSDLVVEVPCAGSAADIDTVEDLRRWQRS